MIVQTFITQCAITSDAQTSKSMSYKIALFISDEKKCKLAFCLEKQQEATSKLYNFYECMKIIIAFKYLKI